MSKWIESIIEMPPQQIELRLRGKQGAAQNPLLTETQVSLPLHTNVILQIRINSKNMSPLYCHWNERNRNRTQNRKNVNLLGPNEIQFKDWKNILCLCLMNTSFDPSVQSIYIYKMLKGWGFVVACFCSDVRMEEPFIIITCRGLWPQQFILVFP